MKLNFTRVFALLAQRFADNEALLNVERNRRYTYRQLHELSNQIANMMSTKLGLGEDDRYVLILKNDNLSLLHFWTIMKGRAAAVFTNASDSLAEHLRQIEFVEPKCVFIESDMVAAFEGPLKERGVTLVAMDGAPAGTAGVFDFWELVEQASKAEPEVEREVDAQPAFYRFTGGTTGIPKCAGYSYRHFEHLWLNLVCCEDGIFDARTRMLHLAPLSHATMFFLPPTFFSGGCNVTQNSTDLALWCENVEQFAIDTSFLVPTLLYRLVDLEEARSRNLSSLRTIAYGGAPMSPAKLGALQAGFGNIFVQIYGSTESFCAVTYLSKGDHVEGSARKLESCGRAAVGVELMVADEQGRELPHGEVGELWHRHRGVISGYYRNPSATAAEFIDGWWKSGDLARMGTDGYVIIVDRKKDVIITGGFNVYAVEVEGALCSHPAVLMCAVVGIPHPEWGEAVLAEVIRRPGADVTAQELAAHVKHSIGNYKAPKEVVFVEHLPVSSVGKVIRKDVRAKYWQGSCRRVG